MIYIAPPQYKNLWMEAMQLVAHRPGLLKTPNEGSDGDESAGLVIVQIDPREYERLDLSVLNEVRQKRYGNTLLVFYERVDSSASA